ncbi:hypothetical protein VCHE09_0268, partial [Vibrio paracholerae HE-09]
MGCRLSECVLNFPL